MKSFTTFFLRRSQSFAGLLVVCLAFVGCSKKETPAPAPAAPVVEAPAAPVANPAAIPNSPTPMDVRQAFAEADAAMKAKAYERAVQAMLAVQKQKQLTESEAQQARLRMISLQSSLATAVANGDPAAKAAADRLRRASMVR
ncbi:MAG: hypothetical protein RL616_429 [Verrucomicrobiota bacterium]|jgi:hypothetical protein